MLKYHVGLCTRLQRRADSVVRKVEVDDGSFFVRYSRGEFNRLTGDLLLGEYDGRRGAVLALYKVA